MDSSASGTCPPQPSPPARDLPGPARDGNTAETSACRDDGKNADAKQRRRANRNRPYIQTVPRIQDMDYDRFKVYTQGNKTESWSKADGMVQEYSDEMIKRWKEEIDTYLVFAGLFSAVLTTFNVQTYVLLQPPAPDASMAVLLQISSQLASFSIVPPFVNSTQLPSTNSLDSNSAPPIPRWAIWLNALWFSGLILSLAAASIGILVKQWLNEYGSGLSGKLGAGTTGSNISGPGTSRAVARVRQYRLENLRTWRVEDIVSTIPILLQLALGFFLAGMLILLWTLHHTVAAIASALVGLLGAFTVVTTLLPLFNHRCSYITPQIRALNALWQPKRLAYWICTHISAGFRTAANLLSSPSSTLPSDEPRPPLHLAYLCHQLAVRVMQPVSALLRQMETWIHLPDIWNERKQTWQGRERSLISSLALELDVQTLLEAYSFTLHPDALSAASVCLVDFDKKFVLDYFRKLHTSAREHFGPAADSRHGPLGLGNQQRMLWLQVLLCVGAGGFPPLTEEETAALAVYFRWGDWSSSIDERHAEWAIETIDTLLHQENPFVLGLGSLNQDSLHNANRELVRLALDQRYPFVACITRVVSKAYRNVYLSQSGLAKASLDNRRAAYTRYLENVGDFLECASTALRLSMPPTILKEVHVYVQDVFIELTGDLLDVYSEGQVRTTFPSYTLYHIMQHFQILDDSTIDACIPDELVPDMLRLMGFLSTHSHYAADDLGNSEQIEGWARESRDTISRVKGNPNGRSLQGFPTASNDISSRALGDDSRRDRQPHRSTRWFPRQ